MNTALALSLWSSLPIPALLIDASDNIADMNPAAEGFMNNSAKWITGQPIWDRLAVDAPIEESFAKARANGTPLFVNDVDVGTGSRPPRICSLHISPLQGQMDWMIVLVSPREAGRAHDAEQFGEGGGEIGHRHGRDARARDQEPARGDRGRGAASLHGAQQGRP